MVITVKNMEEEGTVTLSAQQPKSWGYVDGFSVRGSSTTSWPAALPGSGSEDDRQCEFNAAPNTGDEEVIEGAKSATYTPTAKDDIVDDGDNFYLRATASYTDGKGKDTAMATSNSPVQVRTDNPPKFPKAETGKRRIAENSSAGAEVGDPVRAGDDEEETQLLAYSLSSLSGDDAAFFTITSDTTIEDDDSGRGGQIMVKAGTKLDYEAKSTYMVTVKATDPDDLSASIDVTIKVTNVNEAPKIIVGGLAISGPASVSYAEDRRNAVETYTASGPESAKARWSLEGDDAGDFEIGGSSGVLTFVRVPDYENPADDDMDNTYMVTVKADDGTYMNTRDVTVRVTTDVVEMPVIGDDSLLDTYDVDKSGEIERDEMRVAVAHFFANPPQLTREEMRELVGIYF